MSARPFRLTPDELTEAQILALVLKLLAAHPKVAWAARFNSGAIKLDAAPSHQNGPESAIDQQSIRWYGKRLKNGTQPRYVRFNTLPGCSDILGMLKGGRLIALEVKREGENPTWKQQSFLDQVNRGGGLAACVHSVDEARALIETSDRHFLSARPAPLIQAIDKP